MRMVIQSTMGIPWNFSWIYSWIMLDISTCLLDAWMFFFFNGTPLINELPYLDASIYVFPYFSWEQIQPWKDVHVHCIKNWLNHVKPPCFTGESNEFWWFPHAFPGKIHLFKGSTTWITRASRTPISSRRCAPPVAPSTWRGDPSRRPAVRGPKIGLNAHGHMKNMRRRTAFLWIGTGIVTGSWKKKMSKFLEVDLSKDVQGFKHICKEEDSFCY